MPVMASLRSSDPFPFSFFVSDFCRGERGDTFRRAIKLQITETSPCARVSRKAVCGPETRLWRARSHSACMICCHSATATPRPEGEEQAYEFRKFLYRAYRLPFDCIKHVNS